MSEPVKKPAATPDPRTSGAPPTQYTVRMQWIALRDKDITIGAGSLYGRIEARKPTSPNGYDIWWSPEYRHYWIAKFDDNAFVNAFRLHEHRIDPSQEWQG